MKTETVSVIVDMGSEVRIIADEWYMSEDGHLVVKKGKETVALFPAHKWHSVYFTDSLGGWGYESEAS